MDKLRVRVAPRFPVRTQKYSCKPDPDRFMSRLFGRVWLFDARQRRVAGVPLLTEIRRGQCWGVWLDAIYVYSLQIMKTILSAICTVRVLPVRLAITLVTSALYSDWTLQPHSILCNEAHEMVARCIINHAGTMSVYYTVYPHAFWDLNAMVNHTCIALSNIYRPQYFKQIST